jgi:hypothetical protein
MKKHRDRVKYLILAVMCIVIMTFAGTTALMTDSVQLNNTLHMAAAVPYVTINNNLGSGDSKTDIITQDGYLEAVTYTAKVHDFPAGHTLTYKWYRDDTGALGNYMMNNGYTASDLYATSNLQTGTIRMTDEVGSGSATNSYTSGNMFGIYQGSEYYCVVKDLTTGISYSSPRSELRFRLPVITAAPAEVFKTDVDPQVFTATVAYPWAGNRYDDAVNAADFVSRLKWESKNTSQTAWSLKSQTGGSYTTGTISGPGYSEARWRAFYPAADSPLAWAVARQAAARIDSNEAVMHFAFPALQAAITPTEVYTYAGQTVTHTVNVSGGSGSFDYSWYTKSPGTDAFRTITASGNTHTTNSTTVAGYDGALYYCSVHDIVTDETVSTPQAVIHVRDMTVSIAPATAYAALDQTAVFTAVVAGGTGSYTYQWYKNTTATSTGPTYTSRMNKTSGSYDISCRVTDSLTGQVITAAAVFAYRQ